MPKPGNWEQCAATSKQTGVQCKQPAIRGRRVCHYHGGKSLSGPASPAWKDGRHSKWVPKNWLERYEAALGDDDLMNLRPEISLIDTQITDALERLQTTESDELWERLQKSWASFMGAVRTNNRDDQVLFVNEIDAIVRSGSSVKEQRRELNTLIDQRRRITESAQKIAVAGEKMILIDVMIAHMALLVTATKEAALKYADEHTAREIIVAANTTYQELVGPGTGSRSG